MGSSAGESTGPNCYLGAVNRVHWFLLSAFAVVLLWSGIHPHDYFTWFLEVVPALVGIIVLVVTWPPFRFTMLVYAALCVHAIILAVGGHYTYAEVPLGFWMEHAFGLVRNDYDRIGHFAQGFVPALVAREILVRRGVIARRKWMFFLVVSICLAISAAYELFEWLVALASGSGADAFLGAQGDPWDTQEDMATAIVGAVTALLFFSRWHDRLIGRMDDDKTMAQAKG